MISFDQPGNLVSQFVARFLELVFLVRIYMAGTEKTFRLCNHPHPYIRLLLEFVYLAVILDTFSRRVIGWALGRTLEAELALAALRMAIGRGRVAPGLVHHSDRGVQYASTDYIELLTAHGILISMSQRGNPMTTRRLNRSSRR